MNAFFDLKRFGLLMRREALMNFRSYLLISAFIFGIFFLAYFHSIMTGTFTTYNFDNFFFYLFLTIGGAYFASLAFADVKRPVGYFYLTTPASNFEKVLSKWIITLIGWIAAFCISYYVFSILGKSIYSLVHNSSMQSLQVDLSEWRIIILGYALMHATFFLGASIFKKNAFVLTIVAVSLINMLMSLLALIIIKSFNINFDPKIFFHEAFPDFMYYSGWVVALIMWAFAFNRLHKTQL